MAGLGDQHAAGIIVVDRVYFTGTRPRWFAWLDDSCKG
jgi:hypothetical protein